MLITPEERVVELFVKIILLFVLTGVLIFLLCGCGEPVPVFRCSKCKSLTKVRLVPRFNGKTVTHMRMITTTWECEDADTHSRGEREYRAKRKVNKR